VLTAEHFIAQILSNISRICGVLALAVPMAFLPGCHNDVSEQDNRCLIRVGASRITVQDFRDAFEIAKVAYPHNAMQDPEILKKLRSRLLNQLSDETILLERAKTLQIDVSETELEAAIEEIKADYPEGVFQQVFFESAISYPHWLQRIKTRLLIDRVIEKDLTDKVDITPEDVSNFLKDHDMMNDTSLPYDYESMNEKTIAFLRRKKAEEIYPEWMKKLKQEYKIEIDHELWEKIVED